MDNPSEEQYSNQLIDRFDAHLASHTVMENSAEEMEGLMLARKAIILAGALSQVQRIRAERSASTPVVKMHPYRRLLRLGIAAAACLLILVVGYNRFNEPGSNDLYNKEYMAFEPVAARGEATANSAIEKAYAEKHYAQVMTLYSNRATAGEKMMAGNAALELNRPADAVSIFKSLIETNAAAGTILYNDDAQFYLALAYLKNGNSNEAVKLMTAIQQDAANPYHTKFTDAYIDKVKDLSR